MAAAVERELAVGVARPSPVKRRLHYLAYLVSG
jgi:hypothetical protein